MKKGLHMGAKCHHWEKCSHEGECLFCIMKEQRPSKRYSMLAKLFSEMPLRSNPDQVLIMSGLWNIAMSQPNNPLFVKLGILECMGGLIKKGLKNRNWLLRDQNVYIPYYAAHIIGSYVMNLEEFAKRAVDAAVIAPLLELLRGRMTWVEQRVAVRALGHICSYDSTFPSVAEYEDVIELVMELSSSCLDIVYTQFIRCPGKRLSYHCDLLTRGMGGTDMENKKAEEWASQLQCWSLHLLDCFAQRGICVPILCNKSFVKKLPSMWGGLVNENSPAGIGLLRNLCYHTLGRISIVECDHVVDSFCNVARSSDDWQYMAIESLLLLLKDPHTRHKAIEKAVGALADLVELERLGDLKGVGKGITEILLSQRDYNKIISPNAKQLLDELYNLKRKMKLERNLSKEDLCVKRAAAMVTKIEGNSRFSAGDVKGAVTKYTESLALCPVRARRERMILYSNRAQCHLLLENPDLAISDTTRALSLSQPVNSHTKSLWRRSQAYDMKGLPKESLLDAIMFISWYSAFDDNNVKLPYYAVEMVKKQMYAAWLFQDAAQRHRKLTACSQFTSRLQTSKPISVSCSEIEEDKGDDDEESEWETVNEGDELPKDGKGDIIKSPKTYQNLINRKECLAENQRGHQFQSSLLATEASDASRTWMGSITPTNFSAGQIGMDFGMGTMNLPTIEEETTSDDDKIKFRAKETTHKISTVKNKRR